MKIQIELSGKFTRSLLNATEVIPRTLNYLIHEVQATGTRYHCRTPQLLRQSFGLDFIPEPVLINLCKNSRGVTKESDIYQVPPLKYEAREQEINKHGIGAVELTPQLTGSLHSLRVKFPDGFNHLTNEKGQQKMREKDAGFHISMMYEPDPKDNHGNRLKREYERFL